MSAFSLMEHFLPAPVRIFLLESFEKRLNVKIPTLADAAIELNNRNMTF